MKTSFLLAALLAVPLLAQAAPKPRPLLLQPLQDEIDAKGEPDDPKVAKKVQKALKTGEMCMADDKRWDQALKDGLPINDIYEMLQGAVFCWQNAEKKATKAGDAAQPATAYYTARARYIEAFRTYIWGIEGKLIGDKLVACNRLRSATQEAITANEAAEGLVEKFATDDGKILGRATIDSAGQLGNTIAEEFKNQKCQ